MDFINAIAKVRFGSAKPQRIHLARADRLRAEMLCMEPGQQVRVQSGQWLYYVITGTAALTAGGQSTELPAGQFAASTLDEEHVVATSGDRRLVCLVVSAS